MKSPTQRKIAALKPLEKRYSVALGYGLSLKVQPSGAKSFVLRLCVSGRVTDILLGHFPEITGTADDITIGLRSDSSPQPTGAFYCSKKTLNGGASGGDLWRMDRFQFAAHWSSATYGQSSEVSVSAAYSLIIIKA